MEDANQLPRCRIVYLAPDCTDGAVRKRAHGFVRSGADLLSFSFRRVRYDVDYVPDWPNVELGTTTERKLATRFLMCLRALWVIYINRRDWREATTLYVRNLDLALLAVAAKFVTRCRAPMVFEVLDVHPSLTRSNIIGCALRWLERRVLNRCQLLVVSSPAFLSNYFRPVQCYTGQAFVLENKWPREKVWGEDGKLPYQMDDHKPVWTIAWFGNLRCQTSLDILTELADALPERVKIYMRGCALLLGEQTLDRTIRGRANMVFEGEYKAPEEFPVIYSQVHFNWCADFSDGDNSLWLLPNRLYEGGYFGIPAIAIAGHETGRVVRKRRLGITLEAPLTDHLKKVLLELTPAEYKRMRGSVEAKPDSDFVDIGDMERLLRILPASHEDRPPASSNCRLAGS